MVEGNLESIKHQIETSISGKDFQGLVGYLTRDEQLVLLVLIWSNSALPVRTIRNYIIGLTMGKYSEQIMNKYNFYNASKASVEVPKYEERYRMEREKTFFFERYKKVPYWRIEYSEDTQKQMINDAVQKNQIKHLLDLRTRGKAFDFNANLYQSLLDDDLLFKNNIKPQSYSTKIKLWETALKDLAGIPSWNIVKNSIESLVRLGIVNERKIIGKKSEIFYFVSPIIYDVWKKSREKIQQLIEEKKYKPNQTEKDWYLSE